jgi:uncharacterized protein YqgC (DUF456 family)
VTAILWCAAIALILLGAAGTVLPALPGATLVFGGIVLAAWIDDFARIPVWVLVVLGVLTAMAWIVELRGAPRWARSAPAQAGSRWSAPIVGTRSRSREWLWDSVQWPLAGAAIGEYVAQRELRRAGKVGVATWIGLLLGTAAKVAIVFAMIGIFAFRAPRVGDQTNGRCRRATPVRRATMVLRHSPRRTLVGRRNAYHALGSGSVIQRVSTRSVPAMAPRACSRVARRPITKAGLLRAR